MSTGFLSHWFFLAIASMIATTLLVVLSSVASGRDHRGLDAEAMRRRLRPASLATATSEKECGEHALAGIGGRRREMAG